jgi:hypothetical protein
MNHLVSIRTNIMYAKKGEEFEKFQELILLVDKPSYKFSNEGEVVRERGIEELRFCVSEKAFEQFIEFLEKIKDAKESDLI